MADLRKHANTYAVEAFCLNCHHRETTRLPKGTPLRGKASTCSHCGCTAMLRPVRSMGGDWQLPTLGFGSTSGYNPTYLTDRYGLAGGFAARPEDSAVAAMRRPLLAPAYRDGEA